MYTKIMKQIPENHIQLVGRVTIGARGQIVIPVEIRERLGLLPGEHALALLIPDSGAVAFVHEAKLQELIAKAGGSLAESLGGKADRIT